MCNPAIYQAMQGMAGQAGPSGAQALQMAQAPAPGPMQQAPAPQAPAHPNASNMSIQPGKVGPF